MNIRGYTGRLVAICTVTGLAIGSALVLGYRDLDNQSYRYSTDSLAISMVDNLSEHLGDYMNASDEVLKEGLTRYLNSTLNYQDRLVRSIDGLCAEPLASNCIPDLERIKADLALVQGITERGATLGKERPGELRSLYLRADSILKPLVQVVDDLTVQLRRRASYATEDLNSKKLLLMALSWVSAASYLVVVFMSWVWSVQTMVRPIQQLSNAAERAQLNNEAFAAEESGPDEVRQLTRNISTFVRTRADFLATMSHELRTPLNGIINMNEMMLETKLDSEQREYVRSAKSAGESLLSIINDILDFSKIQANKLELERAPFDVRELLDGALDILVGPATIKGLKLEAMVDHRVPQMIAGDQTRLRQILINLLNNAVKFTAQGSITVTLVPDGDADNRLRFAIRDTGCGITEDTIGTLFRAFNQGDSSTTRKFGGTGLGLAICRELCTLMGGEIGVDSVIDDGSTFWFTIAAESVPHELLLTELPADVRARPVLIASTQPTVTAGVREQLLALGLPAESIHDSEGDIDAFLATATALPHAWLVFDPGDREEPRVLLTQLHEAGAGRRIGMLEWRLARNRCADLPESVDRLPLGTALRPIADWLQGKLEVDLNDDGDGIGHAELHGRVLVVDDNPINRRVARTFLERAGCEVYTADDGQEAIDLLMTVAADIVLMDCQMPRLDGYEATRRLRELQAGGHLAQGMRAPLPIMALTASTEAEDHRACLDAGMNTVLTKPFVASKLIDKVGELLFEVPIEQETPRVTTRKPLILIVDDNPMNQRVAKAIVSKHGFDTVTLDDGQQAVEYVQENRCDMILMDCQMPVLDGWEATSVIREMESLGRLSRTCRTPLPILAVTANAMEGDREKCLAAGMNDHVAKPIRAQALLAIIHEQLKLQPDEISS